MLSELCDSVSPWFRVLKPKQARLAIPISPRQLLLKPFECLYQIVQGIPTNQPKGFGRASKEICQNFLKFPGNQLVIINLVMEFDFDDSVVNSILALGSQAGATQTGHEVENDKGTVGFWPGNRLMVCAIENSSLTD